ncbi:MAG TPA: hypothetical protein VKZ95_07785 [Sphingobacteriaceae bacterium]|nr:hypothetical protein [Sphingobacteriaceae bacterium]
MKKVALFLAVAATVGFTACTKCKICTKESSAEIRLCEKDYNNQTEYGLAVDVQESLGYTCKESL